ncbi:hypothetical protein LL037_15300 [Clostridium estertheticum]|uniref:Uncharacterized protein n=1 Tax=Clostridium estertheticum TaxID=238834 RepID=A0AA47ELC6_9CLOT|nr:hypothetical protein [Clostridium estertheticum]MBU3154530.1 hypothetical protein [Clostridium estertheticum]MBU3201256.1 hypothetical protein [Clostridium estertheticum]WAG62036.1 hypothetical protein LL038_07275 [Clostridium estertheticum]WAG63840.1 hypothetical protein LL037_15300 [Clostridium estertheticum]
MDIEINGEFVDLDKFLESILGENDKSETNSSWEEEILNIAGMSFINKIS